MNETKLSKQLYAVTKQIEIAFTESMGFHMFVLCAASDAPKLSTIIMSAVNKDDTAGYDAFLNAAEDSVVFSIYYE